MAHPTWDMGPVITINSATLVNKGLELIEAHLLFGIPYDRIDVVVHPQSIIHSMVTFTDGSTLAQASPPDMRLPIALALGWPDRVPGVARPATFAEPTAWTFEPLDDDTFPAVRLARAAGTAGGCLPAVYNAANEEAVAAFVGRTHGLHRDCGHCPATSSTTRTTGTVSRPASTRCSRRRTGLAPAPASDSLLGPAPPGKERTDEVLAWLLGIVLFALGICASVALHEAGHMWAAKAFGMKVRRYFIGFGPKIWSFRRGETEYGLKAIPAGGFCDIAGMTALDEVTPEEAPRAMWRYPTWKRFVVMVAGSVTHFILGFIILYLLAATMGLPNVAGTPVISGTDCAASHPGPEDRSSTPKCGSSDPAPARDAGPAGGRRDRQHRRQGHPDLDRTWSTRVQKLRGEHEFVVHARRRRSAR